VKAPSKKKKAKGKKKPSTSFASSPEASGRPGRIPLRCLSGALPRHRAADLVSFSRAGTERAARGKRVAAGGAQAVLLGEDRPGCAAPARGCARCGSACRPRRCKRVSSAVGRPGWSPER
jgi:hypothetical protein